MNNVIKLFGEINQEMYNYVFDEVMRILNNDRQSQTEPTSELLVLINSTKGDYYQGVAILDLLRLLKKETKCVVLGNSCDATNVIFFSFSERYHTPRALLHFDDYYGAYKNLINSIDFKERVTYYLRYKNEQTNSEKVGKILAISDTLSFYRLSNYTDNYDFIKNHI